MVRAMVGPFKGVRSRGQSRRSDTVHKIAALPVATVGLFGHTTPEYLGGLGDESHVAEWLAAFGRPSQRGQLIIRHGMRKQGSIGTLTLLTITLKFRVHRVLGEQGAGRTECITAIA